MKRDGRDPVVTFIQQRFSTDCHWLDGNCYYFAKILQIRFPEGKLYYDHLEGHFLTKINGVFYDWTGAVEPDPDNLYDWDELGSFEPLLKARIVRDCVK